MVRASIFVAFDSRLAALPVGAHSRHLTPLAPRMNRIEFTSVVFPTPGPPVMITSRLAKTSAKPRAGLGPSACPFSPRTTSRPFRSGWADRRVPPRPWF